MATTKDCYFFDFVFKVREPIAGTCIGIVTLTQADANPHGRSAASGARKYASEREEATGLTYQRVCSGKSGECDATIERLIATYGAL